MSDLKNGKLNEHIKISVIIPVYNAEKYLLKCLESVKGQTFKDFEVICVDDDSSDGSVGILKDFVSADKRFSVITQKNSGVHSARARGYKEAVGEYVVFVDNDDFLNRDMLEKLYDSARGNESDIVICNYRLYPRKAKNKVVWYKSFNGKNDWKFIGGNTVPWNKIFRKDFLDDIKLNKLFECMGECAYGIILASTNRISTIDEPLYNYRVGHESVSGNYKNIDTYKKVVEMNKKRVQYAKDYNMDPELQESFQYGYFYYSLVLMSVAARNNDKKTWIESKNIIKNANFFQDIYTKYCPLSLPRRVFLRFFVYRNYCVAKIVTRIVLR